MLSTGTQSYPVDITNRCIRCRATNTRFNTPAAVKVTLMGQICAKRRRERCRAHCVPGCIFCQVVKEAGKPGSRVIYEDELVIALPDIRPAAVEHLLVIPREHVPNVSSLTAADVHLVRHMHSVGQQLLQQCLSQQQQQQQQQAYHQQQPYQQQQQLLGSLGQPQKQQQQQQQQQQLPLFKFGFHKPPFRSVDHLHLHCFMLPHKWYRWVQYQSRLNWITVEELADELARKPSQPQQQQQQQQLAGRQQRSSSSSDAV